MERKTHFISIRKIEAAAEIIRPPTHSLELPLKQKPEKIKLDFSGQRFNLIKRTFPHSLNYSCSKAHLALRMFIFLIKNLAKTVFDFSLSVQAMTEGGFEDLVAH